MLISKKNTQRGIKEFFRIFYRVVTHAFFFCFLRRFALRPFFFCFSVFSRIGRASGDEGGMPVVPNTPIGACQPSREPRVITTATPPFTVVRCNEPWTKLCGYTQVGDGENWPGSLAFFFFVCSAHIRAPLGSAS